MGLKQMRNFHQDKSAEVQVYLNLGGKSVSLLCSATGMATGCTQLKIDFVSSCGFPKPLKKPMRLLFEFSDLNKHGGDQDGKKMFGEFSLLL